MANFPFKETMVASIENLGLIFAHIVIKSPVCFACQSFFLSSPTYLINFVNMLQPPSRINSKKRSFEMRGLTFAYKRILFDDKDFTQSLKSKIFLLF